MAKFKRLKDPIYGYIEIPLEYMNNIIDTAVFQRLRRIIQTSYSPLYSSAVHNRFVHSMGVYHLGEIAALQMKKELEGIEDLDLDIEKYITLFLLACLLHDVGHAPFSHTGEVFYLNDRREYDNLHGDLLTAVNNQDFLRDIPEGKSKSAAPHEIMSAIIGINNFGQFMQNPEEKEFFARCITGYKYSDPNAEKSILNCLILLLNSKVIDVDKLDYLIRDAYITGFETINIDYERLLRSLTLIKKGELYELAYKKNAISVIENVVYAHDSERKWIQNHPVVLYECFILQRIFSNLSEKIDNKDVRLFSKEALGMEGICISENRSIRLLCDDDIIYLMKNVYYDELSMEYFERRTRRHPIWKSEAEYNALFLGMIEGGKVLEGLEAAMKMTADYLVRSNNSWVIDDKLVTNMEAELENLEKVNLDEKTKESQRSYKQNVLKVLKCLQTFANEKGMKNNFIIIMASQFNSGFGKLDFADTNIVIDNVNNDPIIAKVGKIVSSLMAKEKKRDNFFYVFYERDQNGNERIDKRDLCKALYKEFL